MDEHCAICGCRLHRSGEYAKPTKQGRSHATKHHFVAERFFGRSANRKGTLIDRVFSECPWSREGDTEVFCYECHELLLHNPVLLPEDVKRFSALVQKCGFSEDEKPDDCTRIAGRIKLLHDVIERGLSSFEKEET
jgi:hypothetical protein